MQAAKPWVQPLELHITRHGCVFLYSALEMEAGGEEVQGCRGPKKMLTTFRKKPLVEHCAQ